MKSNLFILISLSLLSFGATAQNFWKGFINGKGSIVSREVTLEDFSGIRNGINCEVILTQGAQQKITLEGQENILDNMELEVVGDVLKIKYDQMVKKADPVKVLITLPSLEEASLSGSGSISTTNKFENLEKVQLSLSGSGDMRLAVSARNIDVSVSGSGQVNISGVANDINIVISGSGEVDARDLLVEDCTASISGSGDAVLFVKEKLEAKISGSGNIRYKGDLAKLYSRVSGSGHIKSLD